MDNNNKGEGLEHKVSSEAIYEVVGKKLSKGNMVGAITVKNNKNEINRLPNETDEQYFLRLRDIGKKEYEETMDANKHINPNQNLEINEIVMKKVTDDVNDILGSIDLVGDLSDIDMLDLKPLDRHINESYPHAEMGIITKSIEGIRNKSVEPKDSTRKNKPE